MNLSFYCVCRSLKNLLNFDSRVTAPHSAGDGRFLLFGGPFPSTSTPLLFRIDLLLMPKRHTERLTKGLSCMRLPDKHLRHPNRKFGLHQPWGGTCHPEPSGLMGLIYVLSSSFYREELVFRVLSAGFVYVLIIETTKCAT